MLCVPSYRLLKANLGPKVQNTVSTKEKNFQENSKTNTLKPVHSLQLNVSPRICSIKISVSALCVTIHCAVMHIWRIKI